MRAMFCPRIQKTSCGILIYAHKSKEICLLWIKLLGRISNLTEFESFFSTWETVWNNETIGKTGSMGGKGCKDWVSGTRRRTEGWSCTSVLLCSVGRVVVATQLWNTTEKEGMDELNRKILTVVKESDASEYFIIVSKVIWSGPSSRCAWCCHCHVSLALHCVQKDRPQAWQELSCTVCSELSYEGGLGWAVRALV